jgi:UDPglucose--hexose-1-phosphate uridylyltransferase
LYPHEPRKDWEGSLFTLAKLCEKHNVNLIAIGNGTASRETDKLAGDLIKQLARLRDGVEIQKVVVAWQNEYTILGSNENINYVQIFENKGSVMGCSNPHPHGQIWAQSSLPTEVEKTQTNLKAYFDQHQRTLLQDYIQVELQKEERIVMENDHFVALVPFWAIWPFETMIVSKRTVNKINDFTSEDVSHFALILKQLTTKYDNLFETSFPYSSGIHQAPTDGEEHPEWHFHMHFYPPLLRSATVKKFMVGYEMMGESQRDITPEKSAAMLREQSNVHYKLR